MAGRSKPLVATTESGRSRKPQGSRPRGLGLAQADRLAAWGMTNGRTTAPDETKTMVSNPQHSCDQPSSELPPNACTEQADLLSSASGQVQTSKGREHQGGASSPTSIMVYTQDCTLPPKSSSRKGRKTSPMTSPQTSSVTLPASPTSQPQQTVPVSPRVCPKSGHQPASEVCFRRKSVGVPSAPSGTDRRASLCTSPSSRVGLHTTSLQSSPQRSPQRFPQRAQRQAQTSPQLTSQILPSTPPQSPKAYARRDRSQSTNTSPLQSPTASPELSPQRIAMSPTAFANKGCLPSRKIPHHSQPSAATSAMTPFPQMPLKLPRAFQQDEVPSHRDPSHNSNTAFPTLNISPSLPKRPNFLPLPNRTRLVSPSSGRRAQPLRATPLSTPTTSPQQVGILNDVPTVSGDDYYRQAGSTRPNVRQGNAPLYSYASEQRKSQYMHTNPTISQTGHALHHRALPRAEISCSSLWHGPSTRSAYRGAATSRAIQYRRDSAFPPTTLEESLRQAVECSVVRGALQPSICTPDDEGLLPNGAAVSERSEQGTKTPQEEWWDRAAPLAALQDSSENLAAKPRKPLACFARSDNSFEGSSDTADVTLPDPRSLLAVPPRMKRPEEQEISGQATSVSLADLPAELLEAIAMRCVITNPTALLLCNKTLYTHALPCLYGRVHIKSLDQLRAFVSARSGARQWCGLYARSLRIDIPGVPGNAETASPPVVTRQLQQTSPSHHETPDNFTGVPQNASAKRLLYISQALDCCSKIKHLHLALFAVHHSNSRISSEYRNHEQNTFVRALSGLGSLESILWTAPAAAANIQGFSVVIVDQALQSLALGIRAAAVAAVRIRSLFQEGGEGLSEASLLNQLQHSQVPLIDVSNWSTEAIMNAARGYGHPLRRIELHNAIFPATVGPANLLFTLATPAFEVSSQQPVVTRMHTDDRVDVIRGTSYGPEALHVPHVCEPLLPNLSSVRIDSATNLSPQGVCEMLLRVGRPSPLTVEVTNGFVASIWEARLTLDSISQHHCARLDHFLRQHMRSISRRRVNFSLAARRHLCRLEGFTCRILRGWWLTGRPSSVWPFADQFWQVDLPLYLLLCGETVSRKRCPTFAIPYARGWLQVLTSTEDPSNDHCTDLSLHGLNFEDAEATERSFRQLRYSIGRKDSPLLSGTPPNVDRWRASLTGDERYRGREDKVTVEEWMDDRIQALVEKRMEGVKLDSQLDRIGGGHSRRDARGNGW